MSRVAVVVPFYRQDLRPEEELSRRRLESVLGGHERFLALPESLAGGLGADWDGYHRAAFDDAFFQSVATYSRLLLDPAFYRRFADFEFILIYQLDCLVFEDRLESFCALDFDYVGAPWLRSRERPERGFSRVGNGGLSLRRVQAALAVLEAPRVSPAAVLARLMTGRRDDLAPRTSVRGLRQRLRVAREVGRGIRWYRAHYSLNEDHFWADRAALFEPSFRVADVETGLAFAFDEAPRLGHARLGRLPFGCHGWYRRDREFWAELGVVPS